MEETEQGVVEAFVEPCEARVFERLSGIRKLVLDPQLSLEQLSSNSDINILRQWLADERVGVYRPRFGYNPSTREVSISCKLSEVTEIEFDKTKKSQLSEKWNIMKCMLGLMPEVDLPLIQSENCRRDLNSNLCLQKFSKESGLAMTRIKFNARANVLRFAFVPLETIQDRLSGYDLFRYSRSYVKSDKEKLLLEMGGFTWKVARSQNYILSQKIVDQVGPQLQKYIKGGMKGSSEFFAPLTEKLMIYLWGTAGVGKSTFIHVFSKALTASFQRFLNPTMSVDIVKVPLNAMTPDDLQNILRVHGISDWSVERVIEQSLVKGNVVLLHLEENPESLETQAIMFKLVKKMVDGLLSKYQHLGAKVIFAMTSNYVPDESIRAVFNIIELSAPTHEEQKVWAKNMLQEKICQFTSKKFDLNVSESVYPPYTADLRPLNNWWLCLGYFASQTLLRLENSVEAVISINKVDQDFEVSSVDRLNQSEDQSVSILLTSPDSFFFQEKQRTKLQIVLSMSFENYITPGVVICENPLQCERDILQWANENDVHLRTTKLRLLSDEDKHAVSGNPGEIRGGLLAYIDDSNNKNSTAKILDCHCCTSMNEGKKTHCEFLEKRLIVVFAEVSMIGQFMLRELIEQSEYSRSHRLRVSKSRLCFVLTSYKKASLSPQLLSRAHCFL